MKKTTPPANADAYVASLSGWQRPCVESLRKAARADSKLEEAVKWGHLVYLCDGPVLLIRAEDERVLFGFWHGQRLRHLEPRLKPGGKYEMATMEFSQDTTITAATTRHLVKEAVALNQSLGDPTRIAKKKPSTKSSALQKERRATR